MTSTFPTPNVAAMSPETHALGNRVIPHTNPSPTGRMNRPATSGAAELNELDSSPFEHASRLISETAHDLRAPLTTIREAVRLVRDGELGHVSPAQQEFLSAAINQCNYTSQLVDDMVQSRRFDSGFPNVRRVWLSIDQLRESIETTLQPWIVPRQITLIWDGPFGDDLYTYADPTLLKRLIVNLANNAVRETREGRSVMIRASKSRDQGTIIWSIVDQGSGISPQDMELIASRRAPSRSIGGLGLLICRKLAVAQLSSLRIESRVGTGTAVSFETSTGGPTQVVQRWVTWRAAISSEQGQSTAVATQMVREIEPSRRSKSATPAPPPRKVRIDVPSQSIEIGHDDVKPIFNDQVYLASLSVGSTVSSEDIEALDALLHRTMRVTDFIYRADKREWVIAWDADEEAAESKRVDIEQLANQQFDALRMTWNSYGVFATETNSQARSELTNRLIELIIRKSFSDSQCLVDAVSDDDFHNDLPIDPSPIAEIRLRQQTNWLRNHHFDRL